jgi:SRP-independent targeting protein 2/TMEM208
MHDFCRLFSGATYGENGELIDGGSDLNMGGVLSAYHDLLYLTAAAQLLSVFSPLSWWLLILVTPSSASLRTNAVI